MTLTSSSLGVGDRPPERTTEIVEALLRRVARPTRMVGWHVDHQSLDVSDVAP